MPNSALECVLCGVPLSRRTTGDSERRFCSSRHRSEYYSAARRYGDELVRMGQVTIGELKSGPKWGSNLPHSPPHRGALGHDDPHIRREYGAEGEIRTPDLLITNQLLYH